MDTITGNVHLLTMFPDCEPVDGPGVLHAAQGDAEEGAAAQPGRGQDRHHPRTRQRRDQCQGLQETLLKSIRIFREKEIRKV